MQSLQLAPSVYLRILLKTGVDVELCNSYATQRLSDDDQHCALWKTRNLQIIIKLLGLMGDGTKGGPPKKKTKQNKPPENQNP